MDLIGIMKKEGALSCFSGVFVVLSGVFLFCVVKLGQSSCYEPHLSLAARFLVSPRGSGVAFIIHIPFSVVFGGLINNRTSVVCAFVATFEQKVSNGKRVERGVQSTAVIRRASD